MSVDPTPPSAQLSPESTEAVRGGTKSKFNMVALLGGLLLIILGFAAIYLLGVDDRQRAQVGAGNTPPDAAVFDTTMQPAKGDSPQDGDATDPLNTRKDGPSDPSPVGPVTTTP